MGGGDAAAAAALLSELPFSPLSDEEDEDRAPTTTTATTTARRRSICSNGGCGRPSSVCLCPYLPSEPIPTSTHVLLLHHPHSLRDKTLSTLPPLLSSLRNLHPVPGRKLRPTSHPLLQNQERILFLFPPLPCSPSPLPLSRWAHTSPALIVFDGTWRQAREMVAASMPFLKSVSATHVTLECEEGVEGPSSYESELVVRKEPFEGCVSTMEAVARALRVLERDERVGIEVEETLVRVLRAMVGFQREHLKPGMKARVKMMKKKKKKEEKGMGIEEEGD